MYKFNRNYWHLHPLAKHTDSSVYQVKDDNISLFEEDGQFRNAIN